MEKEDELLEFELDEDDVDDTGEGVFCFGRGGCGGGGDGTRGGGGGITTGGGGGGTSIGVIVL